MTIGLEDLFSHLLNVQEMSDPHGTIAAEGNPDSEWKRS